MVEGLEEHGELSRIYKANNGKDAVDVLNSVPIDALVTDLKMPEMNGLELLTYLNEYFPKTPAIVISAHISPFVLSKMPLLGVFRVLQKPFLINELLNVILEITDPAMRQGIIRGISLSNFIQLVSSEGKTCSLDVISADNKNGVIYFKKGELYNAVSGHISGDAAVIEMLQWPGSEFKLISRHTPGINRNVRTGIMSLLMEAAQVVDEKKTDDGQEEFVKIIEQSINRNDIPIESADNVFEAVSTPEQNQKHVTKRQTADRPKIDKTIITGAPSTEKKQKKRVQYLQTLFDLRGVKAVIFIHRKSRTNEKMGGWPGADLTNLADAIDILYTGAEKMTQEIKLFGIRTLTLESLGAMIMCLPVEDNLLAILAKDSKTLGIVRQKALKLSEKIRQLQP